jgi:hypothetical protein
VKICKISILLILLFTSINILNAQEIHVDPKGNDRNAGTKAQPMSTLEAAKKLVRQLISTHKIPMGGLKVIIHEGTYDQSNTFVLDEKDGGELGKPIIWVAEAGKKVSITGSKTIPAAKFSAVRDIAILNRIDPEARGKLMQVDLKAAGISNLGKHRQYGHSLPVIPAPLELFFNEEPMTLARYPNKGMIKIGKVIDKGSVPRIGDKSNRGAIFNYTDARHAKWVGQKQIWFQGTFNYGFADDYNPVDYIDTANKTVKLAKPHLYGVNTGRDFQTYVALNILEELDMPGEWYADEGTNMLYFWPPANMENSVIQVSMLEEPIIALEGVKNVQLKGLTIEGGRGIGVYMERCNNTLIAGCTVRNVGTSGIFMGQGAKLIDENSSVDDYEGIAV